MGKQNKTVKFGVPGFFGWSSVPGCSGVFWGVPVFLVLVHAVWNGIENDKYTFDATKKMLLRCLKWKSTAGLASFLWNPNCTRSEKWKGRQNYLLNVKCNKILYAYLSDSRIYALFARAVMGQLHLHVFPLLRILKSSALQNRYTALHFNSIFLRFVMVKINK